jgi:hypothetical protein
MSMHTTPTILKGKAALWQKLLLLPLLFFAGLLVLQVANTHANRRGGEHVIFPDVADQARNGHAVLPKATVDIEATPLTERLKTPPTPGGQIAAIVAKTDATCFLKDRCGCFFVYDLKGVQRRERPAGERTGTRHANAAAAEESEASFEELSSQVLSLNGVIATLRRLVSGSPEAK